MGSSVRIGRVFGIPILVNYSWLIIFALVTISLATSYFPGNYRGWSEALYWVLGLVTSLLFFISVLIHELSHSLVAKANGTPVKSITLFVFGGVAEIGEEARRARDEFLMALAGPVSSLVLAGIAGAIWALAGSTNEPLGALAQWLTIINVSLAVFNLIPGFPLDGGRVFRALLWMVTGDLRKSTVIAGKTGVIIAYLFILGGVWLALTVNLFQGLWLAFIGWFLQNAASGSIRQLALQDALKGVVARDVMSTDCATVAPDLSVNELVNRYMLLGAGRCYLIQEGDRLSGMVTLHNIKQVPQERWEQTDMQSIMTPLSQLQTAAPTEEVSSILQRMGQADINQMPVVENDRVIGMIARDNLLRIIALRAELKS